MRSAEGFEWYLDFVDKGYAASEDEVVAVFRVTPAEGVSVESAAGRVASESSIGTWTTLTTMSEDLRRLMARAYEFADLGDGSYLVKVAYPVELFEEGNLSQLVSSVMGNVFGMKALKGLRVEDVYLPRSYVESFRGPGKGIPGVRELLKVRGRPVLATVPKPKVGLDVEEYAEVAREVLAGGVDLLKDDENLTNQRFNRFEERVKRVVRVIDEVEKETGESKGYLANVTAEVKEMERRIKLVADVGNPFIMVDFVIIGWSALQTVRDAAEDYGLAIHAHRAFHAAFTRSPAHGASMFVLAKLARLVGVDHLHVGTPGVGKLEAKTRDVVSLARLLREPEYVPEEGDAIHLRQPWYGLKPVFPTSSGGLHPGTLPAVIQHLGLDVIIQVGGGVLGHPDGPRAGARAVRQAVEAAIEGVPLGEYARGHKELARALEKWGYVTPA